jgi:hypothetical protein
MMVTHCLLALAVVTALLPPGRGGGLRQRLVEAGIEPARADRAIRAGWGAELARRHGLPTTTRAGIG